MTKKKKTSLLDSYHLLSYDTVDSTSAEARRLAEGGASHGAVIWAKRQTKGKGRLGRSWVSESGNLFASFLLAPGLPLTRLPELSFVAALAARETLQSILEDKGRFMLKWPNDVLLNGEKVSGVLVESFEARGKQWAVAGIGINVEHHPDNVMYPATNLKASGVELISAKIVLSRLIHHFSVRYDQWADKGFAPIRTSWLAHAFRLGDPVTLRTEAGEISGIFEDIDKEGQLCLLDQTGAAHRFSTGDVLSGTRIPEVS